MDFFRWTIELNIFESCEGSRSDVHESISLGLGLEDWSKSFMSKNLRIMLDLDESTSLCD